MATLGNLTYEFFTNTALTASYSGTSQFTHESDLSDGDQDIVLYFGSNTASRTLQATSNPGVDQITFTPTVTRDIWVTLTAYTLGTSIEPTTENGFRYVVSTAGTSDTTEPTFPTAAIGDTVVDGTVVWTLTAVIHPITEIKLALTSAGLDTATGGDALDVGTEILSEVANQVEVHMRLTNIVTDVSTTVSFPGIAVFVNSVTEVTA